MPAPRFRLDSPLFLLAMSVGVLYANFRLEPGLPRAAVALTFLLLVPGLVIARVFRLSAGLTGAMLALALSVALETAATLAMIYTDRWSPDRLIILLGGASIVGALIPVSTRTSRLVRR